jgi:phosphotransacetylase
VATTRPAIAQRDLALGSSPTVAEPCREIAADPANAYRYTARGGLVAIADAVIVPKLNAANLASRLLGPPGGPEGTGPIPLGRHAAVQVIQRRSTAAEIISLAARAALDAQRRLRRPPP